ncbi:hypothetical protein [Streptomyces sp. NPDC127038]|uniref:hypothetical protein n=1 Tax=Streptomyces sp. NPDC127038 TaxID=3347114 RepID=UPI00366386AD
MVATLIAVALYVGLPQQLLVVPRYVLPALELLLLVPLIAINPKRLTRQTSTFRILSLALVLLDRVAVLVLWRLVSSPASAASAVCRQDSDSPVAAATGENPLVRRREGGCIVLFLTTRSCVVRRAGYPRSRNGAPVEGPKP